MLLTYKFNCAIISCVSGYSADGSALPWGGRGRGFKSRYSDQISTAFTIPFRIIIAVLIFYSKDLIYKAFFAFGYKISVRIKIVNFLSTEFFWGLKL